MKLKSFLSDQYRYRLSTFSGWDLANVSPFDLAAANFVQNSHFSAPKDCVMCLECDLSLYQWNEEDKPIEEHKRYRPECLFVRSFADALDEITPTKEEIVDKWKTNPFAKDFIKLDFYTDHEINEVFHHRLNKSFKFFNSIDEMFRYFLVYFKVKKGNTNDAISLESEKGSEDLLCKICLTNKTSMAFFPCGHLTCGACAKKLEKCPICNKNYIRSYRVYFA
jgi:baculoviral IAP repeat-containing protein 7/8